MQSIYKQRVSGSGKFCIAGRPGDISCSYTEGIPMQAFPYDNLKRKWTEFVRKHRPGVLCSVHFSKDCFTRCTDLLGPQNVAGVI